ncbi:MAG: SDR family NAD(P)-dependent oxidoreductase [Candidatus Kapaibacterium sp.]|nr:MAG: SDR family NAD(P)-dependent oxidoreductase [Candidatus Kapabacteria bacterium]
MVWLITGISSGLGKALAEALLQKGDFLVGTFRNPAQTLAFNEQHQGKAFAVTMDIANPAQIQAAWAEIEQKIGLIDVLVNNAGAGFVGAVEEASIDEMRRVFDINVFGTMLLTKLALPMLRKQGKGHILQISSHGGIKAFAGFGVYNASKFALEGFSEALAQEIAPFGVKLSIIEPGPFRTNFAGNSLLEAAQTLDMYDTTAGAFRKRMKEVVHGNQEGSPEKAATVILEVVEQSVNTGVAPLRVPLGKVALATIGAKLESVQQDLEAGREQALRAVY